MARNMPCGVSTLARVVFPRGLYFLKMDRHVGMFGKREEVCNQTGQVVSACFHPNHLNKSNQSERTNNRTSRAIL